MVVTAGSLPAGVQQTVGVRMKSHKKDKRHEKEPMKHKKNEPKKKHAPKAKHKKMAKGKSKIEKVMKEGHEGRLHAGSKKGPIVHNPKQMIAIALSEARKSGARIKPAKLNK